MEFSVPVERDSREQRVALTPAGCAALTAAGHTVRVEAGAGAGARHDDDAYVEAGARLVWSREEAFGRGGLVLTVRPPLLVEARMIPPGGLLAGLLNLEAIPRETLAELAAREITALALEQLSERGERPILVAMSEIAGRLAPQLAGRWLERNPEHNPQGRGVLLSGLPGVPPAEVVILGAGTLGANAAHGFAALGARVTLLDVDLRRLRGLERRLPTGVTLIHASETAVARSVGYADVLVGAAAVPGELAPALVSEAAVRSMRPGAVILDLAIDEGGCVATSRPTTPDDPTYVLHGVVHCCLPNVATLVPRSASYALTQAVLPLLEAVQGPDSLREGVWESALVLDAGRPRRPFLQARLDGSVE